jgi:protein-tyrosine sulfotransferase
VNWLHDLKKYLDYFFETKGFTADSQRHAISDRAIQAAKSIRGVDRGPAIIIQGIMPRSGTVYVGELLRRHPHIVAYPYQLWEFPALQLTADVLALQQKFILSYRPNSGKLADEEFLPLFGASLIAYLNETVPPGQRVLAKMPGVQYLSYFFSMFPWENLLILVRDGRDLVHSTLRTWPQLNFLQVCLRWNRSAQTVLSTHRCLTANQRSGFWLAKYEDALQNPALFVEKLCCHFGLDEGAYPYEQIDDIRVIGSSKLESEDKVTWQHLPKPKDFKPTEYWEKWSAVKKLIFKTIAGKSLIELGYCEDMNW